MRYEILGSLRVVDETGVRSLTAPKIETLLAVLVIRADQLTSVGQLMDEIWMSTPPKRAVPAVHVYVSQLRRFLSQDGSKESRIVTRSPGYLLRLGDDETDVHDFARLAREGQSHLRARRYDDSVESFKSALALCRGTVFGEPCEGPVISGFVAWMNALRLDSLASMVSAGMLAGRHRELVPFLYSVIAENPLSETFYQQLMFALHRSGRRAEALKVYQRARDMLRDELGLDPCRSLNELQSRVLAADDTLTTEEVVRFTSAPNRQTPFTAAAPALVARTA